MSGLECQGRAFRLYSVGSGEPYMFWRRELMVMYAGEYTSSGVGEGGRKRIGCSTLEGEPERRLWLL